MEHEQGSGRERALAMASEERELSDVFRRAEIDYEARLSSQVMMLPAYSSLLYTSHISYFLEYCEPGVCFTFLIIISTTSAESPMDCLAIWLLKV